MHTLVVGLDAATWRVIDHLIGKNELSNLQTLIEGGMRGTLQSTLPPMTPLAWTSISTGVNPGKHGIYDFLDQDTDTYQINPIQYEISNWPTIWDIYNASEDTVGILNYPLVRPPPKVDDFFVSGIPASTGEIYAYPEEAEKLLADIGYRIQPQVSPDDGKVRYYEELVDLTETQCTATIRLLEEYDPDLLWPVFMGIDWVQHYLWDETIEGRNAVEQFYIFMDEIVGRLLEKIPSDANVVLLSDHGAKRIQGEIHMNELLEEWGYLKRNDLSVGASTRAINYVKNFAWNVGKAVLPPKIKLLLKRNIPQGVLRSMRLMAGVGQLNMHGEIDWKQTTAFSYGYMGRVFINRSDRYPDGTVNPDEYPEVRDEIIEKLESLSHPKTGERLIERAVPASEVYTGDQTTRSPDVLFVPEDWEYMVYGDFNSPWIHQPGNRIADHDPEGVLIATGENIQPKNVDLSVIDVAPTLLYLTGHPIVEEMDGTVSPSIFQDRFLEENSPTRIPKSRINTKQNCERVTNAGVEEHLEDLGYL